MSSIAELTALGKELGYEGEELRRFVSDEQINTGGSDTEGNQVRVKVKGPSIPDFDENKDDIDAYLRRFEVLASAAKWLKEDWAIILSSHLKGAALEVYVRLPPEDALDYNKVSESLMKRFDCTEEGFRVKFRSVKPQKNELVEQFVSRLRHLLKRWIEMSKCEMTCEGLTDLFLMEQFLQSCGRQLRVHLRERLPLSLNKVIELAESYVQAHGVHAKGSKKNGHAAAGEVVYWTRKGHKGNFKDPVADINNKVFKNDHTELVSVASDMPVEEGILYGNPVKVLRDTGCTTVVARKDLVPVECFTGNIPGTTRLEEPISGAVLTRAGAQKSKSTFQKLKASDSKISWDMDSKEIKKEQEEDPSLRALRDDARTGKAITRDGKGKAVFERGLLFRIYSDRGIEHKQLVLPFKLREGMMSMAHEGILGGHLGAEKTLGRIRQEFYWPGIGAAVKRFCLSCDICQKTYPRGKVGKVPLGEVPLIDTPFKRVAVDLIGPILPRSSSGNKYILTMVDYATRYPEAIALPSIETERVAGALLSFFSRVGVPEEMVTDRGSQFTSQMMDEMCAEQPTTWDRYLPAVLFAYRESPQASMGFSPFELLYGRTVRGPLAILRDLWDKERNEEEVRTTYDYVFNLRERLEETCKLAQEELKKSQGKYKFFYDKKAKNRTFKIGSEVLLLLPKANNKLLLQWKGPFPVVGVRGKMDYEIQINGKRKLYHANMLKAYIPRNKSSVEVLESGGTIAVIEEDPQEDFSPLLVPDAGPSPTWEQTNLNKELQENQKQNLEALLSHYREVMSDIPGRTHVIKHQIRLVREEIVKVKPYKIPYALRKDVNSEIESMKALDIIEPSSSPYSAPMVVVSKPDNSKRICLDFRRLNALTIFDSEPMCDPEQIFASLSGSIYFSKMDLSRGYWQIPLDEDSKQYTAFQTDLGLYQFKVLPFGLVNAPATFNKMMRSLFAGLEGVSFFLDDLIVHSKTWEEHLYLVEEVLRRLKKSGLTAKPTKCFFGMYSIEYLGHVVGENKMWPTKDKVEKIVGAKHPRTKKELRSFLGLCGYYHKFIPNYSTIASGLTDLTKKNQPNDLLWNEMHDRAFVSLKNKIAAEPILLLPDLQAEFVLRTDASELWIGCHTSARSGWSEASNCLCK
ncbi:uncharacterized protein [Macrobrachium rosenbergii]|uniref:uncharacterized protein n=1 Tax=Macrobrachium rosenbergii TaxID=79674 RepID=UPI0034D746E4